MRDELSTGSKVRKRARKGREGGGGGKVYIQRSWVSCGLLLVAVLFFSFADTYALRLLRVGPFLRALRIFC